SSPPSSRFIFHLYFLHLQLAAISTLFPYTTLFRSRSVFADLEPYFEADNFDWSGYNQTVMDAGVWDGHRLVIPLEYKIPMLYTSDRKSTRLNSSHVSISYAVFCLKKKTITKELNT